MKRNSALPTLVILLCLLFASLQMAPLLDLSNQQHLEDFTARRIFTKISVQQQPSFLVDDTRHIEPSMDSTIVEAPNAPGASSQIWQVECVACPDRFGLASDRNLRLDSTGHPHIVYGGDRLFYARYDGANWRHDTVDSGPYVGEFAALSLDANDDPHIAYLDWEHSAVRYARWTGVDWVVQTAVNGESAGGFVSLVLDHNNDPVISYHDRGDLTLRNCLKSSSTCQSANH